MSSESQLTLSISDQASPVWPRRASKACASCRRDKIRCDGSRPCRGCKKKGYPDDQCTDGCEPCRRARARCENGTPCRRCVEMELDCAENTPATPAPPLLSSAPFSVTQDPQGAPPKSPTTRSGDRAKLACSNCRRDNKKCDDQRPCSRCIAREEECIHLPRGPKLVKLRCDGCRSDNKRCEETRPCQHCIGGGKECITAPRKGRGHGNRVKAACMSCRRDKIRCDGDRPCTSCIKKGCECVERACRACFKDGRPAECTHHRIPSGADTAVKADGFRQPESYQTLYATTLPVHGQQLPQWTSHGPGPHSHPLHPLYPSMMPQPQYYFPPQPLHIIQPAFPMDVDAAATAAIPRQDTHQRHPPYSGLSNSEIFTQPLASSSRTLLHDD